MPPGLPPSPGECYQAPAALSLRYGLNIFLANSVLIEYAVNFEQVAPYWHKALSTIPLSNPTQGIESGMRKNKSAALRKPDILESYYQVLIEEGLEGTSISKIASRIGIHPSLIIHYFKNKENMKLEFVDLLIEKYQSPSMINFDHIEDDEEHFNAIISVLFSFKWNRTVDPGVHFGFYYLSLRNEQILSRFRLMFKWLRDYLCEKLVYFNEKGIIKVQDSVKAADYIVTLMEGLEFHSQFLANGKHFDDFAQSAQKVLVSALKNGEF